MNKIALTLLLLVLYGRNVHAQNQDSTELATIFKQYRTPTPEPDKAEQFFLEFCSKPFNAINNPYFMGMAYEELGILQCNKGELKNALSSFDSSFVYSVISKDSVGMASSKNWIGMVYQNFGYQDLAMRAYLEAYRLAEAVKSQRFMVTFQSNIAALYFSMKQLENSLDFQRKSYAMAKQISDPKEADLARICKDMSLIFFELQQTDSAKHYNELARRYAEMTNDHAAMISVHLNNHRIYNSSNPSFAYTELKNATYKIENGISPTLGIPDFNLAEVYQQNAQHFLNQGNQDSAKHYLEKCLSIGERINSLEIKKMSYEGLMVVSAERKDYAKAFELSQKFKLYSDSLFSIEKENSLQQFAIIYETEKREKDMALQKAELALSKTTIKRKNYLMIGVGLLIILLSAVSFILFRNFKLKKKIEQQQAMLNERRRISSELHDDLGAQLSVAKIFLNNLKENTTVTQDSELIENSLGMVESSILHLQNIMHELQNTTLDEHGYIAATEELVNKLSNLRKIKFSLSHTGMEQRLDKAIEHQLFRATQELINNTLKHSEATTIAIDVVNRQEQLVILFEDNGKGFDLNTVNRGNGLNNISNRIASLNGTVTFDTQLGKGYRTIIEINHHHN